MSAASAGTLAAALPDAIAPFSGAAPGGGMPPGWDLLRIHDVRAPKAALKLEARR